MGFADAERKLILGEIKHDLQQLLAKLKDRQPVRA